MRKSAAPHLLRSCSQRLMPTETVIKAQGLGRNYLLYDSPRDRLKDVLLPGPPRFGKPFWALRDVSFEVRRGESIGVIGRNGSGKSTLLQLVSGVLEPSEGTVNVHGRIGALLELGSGFNPDFSGRENVFLNAALLGVSRERTEDAFDEIVRFSELREFIDHPVKTYSSGMFVRLAFAVQIYSSPDILIVDEALSVGDVFFQQKCMGRIRKLLDEGLTLFFVSHSVAAVKSLCDKALFLERGRSVAFGSSDEVCTRYQNSESDQRHLKASLIPEPCAPRSPDISETLQMRSADIAEFELRLSERSGSGDVKVLNVVVSDEHGHKTVEFGAEPTIRIEVFLQATKGVDAGASVGVLIRDAIGNDIVAFNSHFFGERLPSLKENDVFCWDVTAKLPLARGAYSVHVGIKPDPHLSDFYDRCFNAATFEISLNPIEFNPYGGLLVVKPGKTALRRLTDALRQVA